MTQITSHLLPIIRLYGLRFFKCMFIINKNTKARFINECSWNIFDKHYQLGPQTNIYTQLWINQYNICSAHKLHHIE